MASELIVQTLKGPTSGANANKVIIPSGQTLDASAGTLTPSSGQVVQVVESMATGTGQISTVTSTSYTATGFDVSITPKSSTSKLIVQFTGALRHDGGGTSDGLRAMIYRDGSNPITGHSGLAHCFFYTSSDGSSNKHFNQTIRYEVTSGSTSETTFELYISTYISGTSNLNGDWGTNTLSVMEIAG